MSLFDDNFIISMEAKAKAAKEEDDEVKEPAEGDEKECDCGKEDCPKCNPKAAEGEKKDEEPKEECKEGDDGEEPAEGEGADDEAGEVEVDKNAVELAVDNDINADSILEARSFESLVATDAEDAHYACLEAVSATIAFDQADIACTEAYVAADSAYEKQMITESFKDSVKKYGARFKQFLIKIKNAIVRIFSKAVNYIKILGARIAAKFASLMKVKNFYDNAKVKVNKELLDDFTALCSTLEGNRDIEHADKTMDDWMRNGLKNRGEMSNLKLPTKADLVKYVLGDKAAEEVSVSQFSGGAKGILTDLKQASISKCVKVITAARDKILAQIKQAEQAMNAKKDINSEEMTIMASVVNKRMSLYNTRVNSYVALFLTWINARAKAVRAAAGGTAPKEDKKEEKKGATESANLFDVFLSTL